MARFSNQKLGLFAALAVVVIRLVCPVTSRDELPVYLVELRHVLNG